MSGIISEYINDWGFGFKAVTFFVAAFFCTRLYSLLLNIPAQFTPDLFRIGVKLILFIHRLNSVPVCSMPHGIVLATALHPLLCC
ncbi:MAG: hypothetical protein ABI921_13310, partial [Panacibacter sp.]